MPNDGFDDDHSERSEENDEDTELILDYLSDRLDPEDVRALEDRAKIDREFRVKLADVVLLKGLVMLALERNPGPASAECRRTQKLFRDYRLGRTSPAKTAQLSRHIDDCIDCELAYDEFNERESREPGPARRGGWGKRWRSFCGSGRRLTVAGLVAVALAAGAFGVVSMLSASKSGTTRAGSPAGPVRPAGTMLSPDEVRSDLAAVRAANPDLAEKAALTEAVEEILDDGIAPWERSMRYADLGRRFGASVEPLLWACAKNDPDVEARIAAYHAIGLAACDRTHLLAATARELRARSTGALLLLPRSIGTLGDEATEALHEALRARNPEDAIWRAQVLRIAYGPRKTDPVVRQTLDIALRSPEDRIRAHAVHSAAAAGESSVMPTAIDLLRSSDATSRAIAALVVIRSGSTSDFKQLLGLDWSQDPALWPQIDARARAEGLPVSQTP
jgi:hypothetical protein